jgi:hypothetical protein
MKLDKLMYGWFTAMWSKGKPVIGHMFMGKGKSFCVEMKMTQKSIFKDGWQ